MTILSYFLFQYFIKICALLHQTADFTQEHTTYSNVLQTAFGLNK